MQRNTVHALLAIQVSNSLKANIWYCTSTLRSDFCHCSFKTGGCTRLIFTKSQTYNRFKAYCQYCTCQQLWIFMAPQKSVIRRKISLKSIKFNVKISNHCRKIRNYSGNFLFLPTLSPTLVTGKTRNDQTGKENIYQKP